MLKKMDLDEFLSATGTSLTWSRAFFPVDLCTVEVKSEPGVFDSDSYFLCMLVDVKSPFVSTAEIRTLRPYVYHDVEKYETLYGWMDSCGNVYDHQDHDIHNDRERVVAWKAL